ncbi:MAG: NAD-binding protein [Gomphosphaeria aponina SAG 52.96 = DSM 107014]|uniref:NAD-binding protein n=1 Tax=Gomphosphaeria aponina SAG 52.96 = DSM 107014 TaxID=1521640 RepID=A0A941JTH8_9CHRO|nr:NAD-binding protein [Gomphosphaeria aponina SAG 52.96 = DSM 107014]
MERLEINQPQNYQQPKLDRFLVCGLGSNGQNCVVALREFGVKAIAIEQVQPQNWEIPDLPNLLEDLIIGDCRQNSILLQAKIERCRAALLVTSNEQVNAETALAVRQLNPRTRIVVRSTKENLNRLLSEQLGNFIAFDPNQLPATAFALAALGTEVLGLFKLDGKLLMVGQRLIKSGDSWCNRFLYDLNSRKRRILAHLHSSSNLPSLHQWNPDTKIIHGDTIIYIEATDRFSPDLNHRQTSRRERKSFGKIIVGFWLNVKNFTNSFLQLSFQQQIRRVAFFSGIIVLVLLLIGTILLKWYYPETTWFSAFSATAILLLGGYSDLFGEFEPITTIPWWLQLFALELTVVGTVFVGVLYALLTEALLSSKFQFVKRRPPTPQNNHVVIVGLGRIGKQVATLLQEFKQAIVGISLALDFDRSFLPQMPLIVGNLKDSLPKANLATAKSVVVLTDDEILNLEIALMTREINPNSNLILRTYGQNLSNNWTQLLPNAQILGVYAVAAEAFAAAAFGENIIDLFRLNNQTILVTEYELETEDTLNGLLIAEVAYGYGVVVILHQKPSFASTLMPSDDLKLAVGDRLVVLATINGLRRVEEGNLNLINKCWQVRIEAALTSDALFEGANIISRISGCDLNTARELMNHLPDILSTPLYQHQAQRLVRELSQCMVKARLVALSIEI